MYNVVLVLGSVEQPAIEKVVANLSTPSSFLPVERIANTRGPSERYLTSPTACEQAVARELAEEFVTNITDVELIVYEAGLGDGAALGLPTFRA